MRTPSPTHLVLIPSYNTGYKLRDAVMEACRNWNPVWVVLDGSTDASAAILASLVPTEPGLRVFSLPDNVGKGAAVLHGVRAALSLGYTHALTMDADGQHPAGMIETFMAASQANPEALILGKPVYDETAPPSRVRGRRISNWWANLETLWCGIGDSLLGFRVYPLGDLRAVMESVIWMRRFDFDPEAAVRLCWRGLRPLNLEAPTRYFRPEDGGVSHFHYVRDNALLTWMHIRLMLGFLLRMPMLLRRRLTASRH